MNDLIPLPFETNTPWGQRKNTVRVIAALRPFQEARVEREFMPGETVWDLVRHISAEPGASKINRDFLVLIDGTPVPEELQRMIKPKAGTTLVMNSRANWFVAPIFTALGGAFTAFSTFLAGSSFFSQLLLAGLSIGLKLLLGLLFPPPKPEVQRKPKEAYNFSGARNQSAPFDPIPVVLGTHRVTPYYGGNPYTEDVGSDQYMRCLFVVGYGPLDISDIRLGETPIGEFSEVDMEVREGYADDTPQTLYPRQVIEELMNVTLEGPPGTSPTEYNKNTRYTASNINRITVNFFLPQGLIRYDSEGKKSTQLVTVKIRYRAYPGGGAWTNITDIQLLKKTINPIRVGRTWAVTEGPQYEVEVWRVEEEPGDDDRSTRIRTVQWGSIKGHRRGAPITFDQPLALIALRIKATSQLSGTVDTLNCLATSKVTSWQPSLSPPQWTTITPSRYPHDLFRWVLQGPANRRPVANSKLDLTQLQAWGTYCRQQGYQYNKPIMEQRSVFDTLQEIAAAGRASVVFKDGRWSVVFDEQVTTIVQAFSPRNSRNFQSTHNYVDLPHAFRVKFVDQTRKYVQNERIVYDDGYSVNGAGSTEIATKFEGLEFPGITHPDLIWKFARYHIAQLRLQPEVYEMQVDFEQLRCTRGDRVRINHDVILVGTGSGRVKEVIDNGTDAQSVIFDEYNLFSPGTPYAVRFRLRDGTYLLRSVMLNTGGNLNALTFTGNDALPEVDDLAFIGPSGDESAVYRVLNILQKEDMGATLQLVDDAPAIYDADTGLIPAFDSNVTVPVDLFTMAPTSLSLQQSSYQIGNVIFGSVTMSWVAPPYGDVAGYDTQYYDDGIWLNGPSVPGGQLYATITGLEADAYAFRVRARFNDNGPAKDVSSWLTSGDFDMSFLSNPPPTVQDFRINSVDANSTLTWLPVTAVAVSYEIRFVHRDAVLVNWNNGVPILTNITGTSAQVPTLIGTYFIKAVSASNGTKSLEAAFIKTDVLEVLNLNAVEDTIQDPTFSGTKVNTVVTSSRLELANFSVSPDVYGVVPEGYYYFDAPVDLGEVFTSRVTPLIEVQGNDVTNVMSSWPTLDSVAFLDSSSQSSWGVELQIRTAQSSVSPIIWTDWAPFFAGDVTAQLYDFRLYMWGTKADEDDLYASVTPSVAKLRVQIDMPDRVVAGNDIATVVGSPATSHRINFDPPFRELLGLGVAVQNQVTTDRYAITAKDEFGFNIQFFTTTTSPASTVSRTFDYVAKGYGRQL